jgi:DNA-binding MarR family transcriptional regulator
MVFLLNHIAFPHRAGNRDTILIMKRTDTKNVSSGSLASAGKRTGAGRRNGKTASAKALVEKFDLHNSPGHLLRRCHSRARAIFDDLVGRETGLSKQQVAMMVTISHIPAATQAQLSEETGFDRNTLADTIDRLIAKGLAVRERSARDARAYEIRLTDAGQAQLEDLIPLSFEVQRKIIEPLPEASRQHFIECLQILAGVAEPEAPPGATTAPKGSQGKLKKSA